MQQRVLLVAIVCAFAAAACGRKMPPVPAPPPPPPVRESASPSLVPDAAAPAAAPEQPSEDELFAKKTLDELNAERPLADAFFDFDQWDVRADSRTSLQRNADWLRRWPSTRITIEGHCDARGTGEYNLALGERRAAAVRSYLVSLGIEPERLLVVSKGEESPFCSAESEECWQQNRRGHFVITAK